MRDILARLPVEDLEKMKGLGKRYVRLVRSESLVSPPKPGTVSLLISNDHGRTSFMEFSDVNAVPEPRFYNFYCSGLYKFRSSGSSIIGSVDGLVCYSSNRNGGVSVLNPMTREIKHIQPPNIENGSHLSCGFGYTLNPTKQYQVVSMFEIGKPGVLSVWIYTLGKNLWDGPHTYPQLPDLQIKHYVHGVFASGALHFLDVHNRVAVFDLNTVTFTMVLSPPILADSLCPRLLNVYNGKLCYSLQRLVYSDQHRDPTMKNHYIPASVAYIEENNNGVEREINWQGLYKDPVSISSVPLASAVQDHCVHFFINLLRYSTPITDLVQFRVPTEVTTHFNTLISLKQLGEDGVIVMDPYTPQADPHHGEEWFSML